MTTRRTNTASICTAWPIPAWSEAELRALFTEYEAYFNVPREALS